MPSRSTDTQYSANSSASGDDLDNRDPAPPDRSRDDTDDLLADLDPDALAGTETHLEVIEEWIAERQYDRSVTADDSSECQNRTVQDSSQGQNEAASDSSDCQNDPGDFDNLSKEQRYVSRYRDAKTIRCIRSLHETPELAGDTTLLVSKPLFLPPSLPPHKLAIFKPWWHEQELPELPAPARQYRRPTPWRDVSDIMQVTFRHLAVRTMGPVFTLNLNLSREVEALARSQPNPCGWLHDRIDHHLRKVLKRPVEFHLVLQGERRRLHIHGEFQIASEEAADARAALRNAGGRWDADAQNKQAETKPRPDAGWLNYITRDLLGFSRNFLLRYGVTSISPISSTLLLKQRSKQIYEAHRKLIVRQQKLERSAGKPKSALT